MDPLWPVLPATEVSVRFFSRDFEAAVQCGKKAVELHPYISVGRCFYAQALEYSGRIDEALREYQIASIMSPGMVWLRLLEGACLAKNGRADDARRILEDVQKIRATEYVDAYYVALLHDNLGCRDLAFQELERAYEENSVPFCLLDVDPKMDTLRQDSQFDRFRKSRFAQLNLWDSSQRSTARA